MTAEKTRLDLATVEFDAFETHLGSRVTLHRRESEESLDAVLERAVTLGSAVPGRRHAFSLTFKASCEAPMAVTQGLFAVDHPAFESFDLFLVPVAADQGSISLEAVVN